MSKRIYLAGPMRGYVGYNFVAFEFWARSLRGDGYEVFSPAEADLAEGFDPAGRDEAKSTDYYLHRDLPEVQRAGVIALIPGWEGSEGTRRELWHALGWGKEVMVLSDE